MSGLKNIEVINRIEAKIEDHFENYYSVLISAGHMFDLREYDVIPITIADLRILIEECRNNKHE